MPDDVRRPQPAASSSAKRILGHLLDGDRRAGGLALSHPAVVERQAGIPVRQGLHLGAPAVAVDAHALDQQDRGALPLNLIGEPAAAMIESLLHGKAREPLGSSDTDARFGVQGRSSIAGLRAEQLHVLAPHRGGTVGAELFEKIGQRRH